MRILKETTSYIGVYLKYFLFFLVTSISLQITGQKLDLITAKITPWYQNKRGAVSLSFDDAGYSQFACAYPIMEQFGFKGTFSIVGEWVQEDTSRSAEPGFFEINRMGWKQLLELHDHGHELAAHGMIHKKYEKYAPVPELAEMMREIKSLIESRSGAPVYTIHYPYSFASENIPPAACEAGYLFGRSGLDTVNSAIPENMYLLASQAVLNNEIPDSALFMKWLDETENNWLILMYHHFFTGDSREVAIMNSHNVSYSYSITPELFKKQAEMLAASGYWVGTISEVGKYITQRENSNIILTKGKKKIYIEVGSSLEKTVYNQPMTIEVNLPWEKYRVEGCLSDGVYTEGKKLIYVNVIPGQKIILTKE